MDLSELAECGIPYKNEYLPLPDGKLRINQSGHLIDLYSSEYKIAVVKSIFKNFDSAFKAYAQSHTWFSWHGPLQKGDLVLFFSPVDRNNPEEKFQSSHLKIVAEIISALDSVFK